MSNRRKSAPTAPAAAPKADTRSWLHNIGEILLHQAAAMDAGIIPRREHCAPKLPPGVVPKGARMALDSGNAQSMYGFLNNSPGFCGLGFPGYPYLSELMQRSEYRSPVEVIAGEMTREWVTFNGASEKEQKELTQAFQDFNIRECFRQMVVYDGAFGRGQLYVHVKGQDSDQRRKLPLIVDDKGATIQKGSLIGFMPIEPIWTTPYSYNSIDPTLPTFYKPEWWYVMGKQTHSSRLLSFVGRPLPNMLMPSYNFGGMALTQLMEPYVVRWLKTVDSVNRLISNFSITALMTNMGSTLEEGGDSKSLFQRAQLFNSMRDTRGLMLMDKDSEELVQKNTPLSGLSDLQAQAQEHMAAVCHLPLVKLTGITPSGLNASSEGEIKVLYDYIGAEQKVQLAPHLATVLRMVQCHLWGKVNPDIKCDWVPLDTPSDKEESEMRKADGDRDTGYVTAGVVSPDEVRNRLRNDPKSGYTFLKGEAPAPMLDKEHELGEESADNAHERSEEAAGNAHKRQKELDKGKPKK